MHKVVATLELSDFEQRIMADTAKAYGMEQQEFLDRCLARGVLVAEGEYFRARHRGEPPEFDQAAIDDGTLRVIAAGEQEHFDGLARGEKPRPHSDDEVIDDDIPF